ncbi:MAG: ATP-binding protein [Planctomycetes bacterium]|uniref:sigma 54-interacting transcriptional regulator n=1 Tax=Candidatus Wunengus californicus TaxID=3367619 RepID=UPI004027E46D|nr:ATP-binding protein [Planctomycetota bacterium]
MECPDLDLERAIKAFRNRYYPDEPDEPDDSKKHPWKKHAEVCKGQYKIEDFKNDVIKHELTWHWRLLLPHLPSSLSSSDSTVLCVSQIRQWQLVSCFQMKWPTAKDKQELIQLIRSEKKNLLRPPVFGKSHRITQCEVYASFYFPEVLREIKEAVNKATAESNAFRLAHILGRYDTYVKIIKPSWNDIGKQYEMSIEQVIDLDPEHESAIINIDPNIPPRIPDWLTTGEKVCRPYGSVRIPQFKEKVKEIDDNELPKKEPKKKPLLFSSDNYCRAFEQVSDVLNDQSKRQVLLIIAPPGSGKENLSDIFHTCREKEGFLIKTSLAGLDEKSAAFQLFNLQLEGFEKRIEEKANGMYQPREIFKATMQDGAIFKALRGTLIIDELDKANNKVRAMLLRFLESDDVAIPGTSIVLKIPEEMRPLYVFAGSKTKKEFLQLGPIDFWSRITHIVEMQHPLELGEIADRLRVTEDYVRSFWFERVEAFFDGEKWLKVPKDYSGDPSKGLDNPIREKFETYWKFFVSRDVGDFVAMELAEAICGQGKPIPSVRTIRGTVSRCFNSFFHSLLYNKKSDASLEKWRSSTTVKEPLTELLRLMGDSLKQEKPEEKIETVAANALKEIRMLIRASVSIQV